MSELLTGWGRISLGEVAARHVRTIDPSSAPGEEFELYSVPAFLDRKPETRLGRDIKSAKQIVQEGDVLLCKIVPHINRVWTVGAHTGRRQIASGEWIIYRDHHCVPDYLRNLLTEGKFRERFLTTVAGVGGSLMRAKPRAVAEFDIPIAPEAEQRRIVTKINSLSAQSKRARDHLGHIPRLIERYKQAILAAAFSGDLTEHWRRKRVHCTNAGDYVAQRQAERAARSGRRDLGRDERAAQIPIDDEIRARLDDAAAEIRLPDTWCWTAIGAVFGVYVGATPSRNLGAYWNGSVPWVSSGEVAFCRIHGTEETITERGLAETSTRLHPPGTVLIGMIGEGRTRGQAAILAIEAANNQNCAAIRVSEAAYAPAYLYWYLWMSYARTRAIGAGNNQQALNKERVQNLLMPVAPPAEAEEVVRRIETAFARIDRLAAEAASARKLIDHLDQAVLAKAFRGELVLQDPADEPASVLLDRIRVERAETGPARRRRGPPVALAPA